MSRNRDDGANVPFVYQGYGANKRNQKVIPVKRSTRAEYDPDPQGVGFGLITRDGLPWPPKKTSAG